LNLGDSGMLEIPDSLSSLMSLKLSWNHFERIPANIKQLSKLIKVVLDGFKRLRCLLELNPPSLQVLIASDCVSLESVASVSIQGEKEYEAASQQFNFVGCFKSDQNSCIRIMCDTRL